MIRERDLDAKDELLLTSHPFFMAMGYSQDATPRNSASGFLQEEERPLRLAPRGSRLAFVRSTRCRTRASVSLSSRYCLLQEWRSYTESIVSLSPFRSLGLLMSQR
jgi:hypothetical protein